MASPEPMVKWHVGFPVITLEIAVMQLMEIRGRRNLNVLFDDQFFEPDMTLCWRECSVLPVHQHMDRVRGHDPMDQDAAEVKNMLKRVHSHARPRTDVNVFMMKIVRGLVKRRPM